MMGSTLRSATIAKATCVEGIGLHSGRHCKIRITPAPQGTGIRLNGTSVTPDIIRSTTAATTLETQAGPVSTVEHLFAALHALGIDDVHLDVEGSEIPILDGSAAPWYSRLIPRAHGISQTQFSLPHEIELGDESSWIRAEPADALYLDVRVHFPGHREQRVTGGIEWFVEAASARTFGYYDDWPTLKKMGLAQGASMSNTLVLDAYGQPMNTDGWRMSDELVRHKWLDLVGDLRILPFHLVARITAYRSGHSLHRHLIESIFHNWKESRSA